MEIIFASIVPAVLSAVALTCILKKTDLYSALTDGAKAGLSTTASILPSLVIMLTAIAMFRASGALDLLVSLLSPLAKLIGIPAECIPLMLIRPLSGSGALALGVDIITANGVDSLTGRTAAVMLGSTETTFYTISVYFGAAGIKNTRHTIPSALIADLVGFVAAAFFTRIFFS